LTFDHNFGTYKPIFKVLSLAEPLGNFYVFLLEISTSPQLCC